MWVFVWVQVRCTDRGHRTLGGAVSSGLLCPLPLECSAASANPHHPCRTHVLILTRLSLLSPEWSAPERLNLLLLLLLLLLPPLPLLSFLFLLFLHRSTPAPPQATTVVAPAGAKGRPRRQRGPPPRPRLAMTAPRSTAENLQCCSRIKAEEKNNTQTIF